MMQLEDSINEADLLTVSRDMRESYPEMGEVMVLGRLRAQGYAVSHHRVWQAIRDQPP